MKYFITTWDAEPRIIWSLKIFIINMIQILTFYMDAKLTNVILTLGCALSISIFYIGATYFTWESYIRIWRNTHLLSILIEDLLMLCVKLLGCAMIIYAFPCGLGSYIDRYKKLIKYDIPYEDNKLLKNTQKQLL